MKSGDYKKSNKDRQETKGPINDYNGLSQKMSQKIPYLSQAVSPLLDELHLFPSLWLHSQLAHQRQHQWYQWHRYHDSVIQL